MRKFFTVFLAALMVSGFAVAGHQAHVEAGSNHGDNSPKTPGTDNRPDNVPTPDEGVSGGVGNFTGVVLPDQANDVAKQVVNTVFDKPVGAVGDALQNLLGGGNPADLANNTTQ